MTCKNCSCKECSVLNRAKIVPEISQQWQEGSARFRRMQGASQPHPSLSKEEAEKFWIEQDYYISTGKNIRLIR